MPGVRRDWHDTADEPRWRFRGRAVQIGPMDPGLLDLIEKLAFALAGGLIAYVTGRAQAHAAATQRRRVTASAIGSEILRIGNQLTKPSTDFETFVARTPEIHPWFERVIIDAAEIDATIPTRFIVLKERLDGLRPLELAMRNEILRLREQLAVRAVATSTTHDLDLVDEAIAATRRRLRETDPAYYEGRLAAMEMIHYINASVRAVLPKRIRGQIRFIE